MDKAMLLKAIQSRRMKRNQPSEEMPMDDEMNDTGVPKGMDQEMKDDMETPDLAPTVKDGSDLVMELEAEPKGEDESDENIVMKKSLGSSQMSPEEELMMLEKMFDSGDMNRKGTFGMAAKKMKDRIDELKKMKS